MTNRLGITVVALATAVGGLFSPLISPVSVARADSGPAAFPPVPVAAPRAPQRVGAIERVLNVTPLATGMVARRLSYPRLRISLPIKPGNTSGTGYERIAYHYPKSGWPGSGRSTYLYGHARVGTFIALWHARKGDVIYLTLKNGHRKKYTVYARIKVAWHDRTYIYKRREILALQTCLGRLPTTPRLIVLAKPSR